MQGELSLTFFILSPKPLLFPADNQRQIFEFLIKMVQRNPIPKSINNNRPTSVLFG